MPAHLSPSHLHVDNSMLRTVRIEGKLSNQLVHLQFPKCRVQRGYDLSKVGIKARAEPVPWQSQPESQSPQRPTALKLFLNSSGRAGGVPSPVLSRIQESPGSSGQSQAMPRGSLTCLCEGSFFVTAQLLPASMLRPPCQSAGKQPSGFPDFGSHPDPARVILPAASQPLTHLLTRVLVLFMRIFSWAVAKA